LRKRFVFRTKNCVGIFQRDLAPQFSREENARRDDQRERSKAKNKHNHGDGSSADSIASMP
jgi:hypothetical protein